MTPAGARAAAGLGRRGAAGIEVGSMPSRGRLAPAAVAQRRHAALLHPLIQQLAVLVPHGSHLRRAAVQPLLLLRNAVGIGAVAAARPVAAILLPALVIAGLAGLLLLPAVAFALPHLLETLHPIDVGIERFLLDRPSTSPALPSCARSSAFRSGRGRLPKFARALREAGHPFFRAFRAIVPALFIFQSGSASLFCSCVTSATARSVLLKNPIAQAPPRPRMIRISNAMAIRFHGSLVASSVFRYVSWLSHD